MQGNFSMKLKQHIRALALLALAFARAAVF
jgi:hypothetical protein